MIFKFAWPECEFRRLPFHFSANAERRCRPSSWKVFEKSVRELSGTLNFNVSCLGLMASRSRPRAEEPHWFCWFSYMKNNKTKKAGIMWIKTFRVSCGALRPPRQWSKVSKTFRTKFENKFPEVSWTKSVKRLPKKKGGNKFADALLLRACARCDLGRSVSHCATQRKLVRDARGQKKMQKKVEKPVDPRVSRRSEIRVLKKNCFNLQILTSFGNDFDFWRLLILAAGLLHKILSELWPRRALDLHSDKAQGPKFKAPDMEDLSKPKQT